MKRIIITSALISLSLLTVVSCGKKDSSGYSVVVPTAPEKETAAVSENVQESTDAAASSETEESSGSSVLIAYFSNPQADGTDAKSSASRTLVGGEVRGNVEYAAMIINAQTGGDMFRIETTEPYPDDYDETTDQAKKEKNDIVRPELKDHLDDISSYDTVYLGFANWWGDMPMAVYSFLDEYDLTGKDIRLFVCHGGSGASSTVSSVKELEPGANVDDDPLTIYWNDIPEAESKISDWLE